MLVQAQGIKLWKDKRDLKGAKPVWYYSKELEKQRKIEEAEQAARELRREELMALRM